MRFEHVPVCLLFILYTQSAADVLVRKAEIPVNDHLRNAADHWNPVDRLNKDVNEAEKPGRLKLKIENEKPGENINADVRKSNDQHIVAEAGSQNAGNVGDNRNEHYQYKKKRAHGRGKTKEKLTENDNIPVAKLPDKGGIKKPRDNIVPRDEVQIKRKFFDGDKFRDERPHLDIPAHRVTKQPDLPLQLQSSKPAVAGLPQKSQHIKVNIEGLKSQNAEPLGQEELRRQQQENGRRHDESEKLDQKIYRENQEVQQLRHREEVKRRKLDEEMERTDIKKKERGYDIKPKPAKDENQNAELKDIDVSPHTNQPLQQPQPRDIHQNQEDTNQQQRQHVQQEPIGAQQPDANNRESVPQQGNPSLQGKRGDNADTDGQRHVIEEGGRPADPVLPERKPMPPARVDPVDQSQSSKLRKEVNPAIGQAEVKWDGDDMVLVFGDSVYMEQKIRRASVPTSGAPWPKPQYMKERKTRVYQLPLTFDFNISDKTCDIIEEAAQRYRKTILKYSLEDMHDNLEFAKGSDFTPEHLKYSSPPYLNASFLGNLAIRIRTPCVKFPSESMDESYTLVVKKTRMYIASNEVWGALRGLETFSQLVAKGSNGRLYIREVLVNDYPRFAHRGVLIDTSRHYIFKEVLYDVLEGMAQNKLNVMHWHIVDDQSFPFESSVFPDLSKKGAFHEGMVYTKDDISDIIEYARLRGIRVVPEFDTPGHTYSWGMGYPDLLTQCYSGASPVNGYLGPINPSSNYTYDFLKSLFREILAVFKDKYVHLGGDEVPLSCWVSNPDILAFSEKIGAYGDTRKLMEYYETKLLKIMENLADKKRSGIRTVVWQDVIDTVDQLPERVVIHVWKGGMPDVQRATSMGHHVIYSTCWYLDLIEYGSRWYKYYLCDPTDPSSGYIDERLVLGGEAALWAEYIDNENLMTTLWPRASAVAERLWSHKDQRNIQEAGRRMLEHRCRMLGRGLGVSQVSGPDYCPSRGPRKTFSASRLMEDEEGEIKPDEVPGAQKKKVMDASQIELERIDFRIGGGTGSGAKGSDCGSWAAGTSIIPQSNGWVLLFLTLIILAAVIFQVRSNSNGYSANRILKNKTILFSFVTLLVIYITCYTTIWLQVLDVKRSFLRVEDSPMAPNPGNVFRS